MTMPIYNYWYSFDYFVCKLNVSLPLVIEELSQNTVDLINSVAYKMFNVKILRQFILLSTKNSANNAGNYVTTKALLHHRTRG